MARAVIYGEEYRQLNLTEEGIRFQRAWVSQFHREHEYICWSYGVDLTRPIIEISNSKMEWGAWDEDLRTMRVSAFLIREHPWDVTLNVFKHEIAHQIVTDLFNTTDGHGHLFQTACNMIGVPEGFRGAKGDLPRKIVDFRAQEIDSANARMLDKVRKLLSLAQSGNENEAFFAMKKANELIEKYNIDRIEHDKASRCVHAIINHKKKRTENYQRRICLILREHFFVDVVYSHLYDADDCQTYRTIELLGTVENVRIAEYVYYFLLNQMEVLWKAHQRKEHKSGSGNKRSYRLGVLRGLHDKLDQQANERKKRYDLKGSGAKTMSALICAGDKMLREFTRMRFPRLSNYRSQGATIDYGMFQAGIDDGKRLNIYKGIQQKDGYQGRLLPGFSALLAGWEGDAGKDECGDHTGNDMPDPPPGY